MKSVEFEGRTFKSETELCQFYNISRKTFATRKHKGWSIKECIYGSKVHKKGHYKTITFEGKTFESMSELCKLYNIEYNNFKRRRKIGWSLTECIYGKYKIEFENKKFKTYRELCGHYNISYSTFRNRKNKGYSLYECIYNSDGRIKGNPVTIEFENKTFKSVTEFCDFYNLKRDTFYKRKLKGYTLKECIYGKEKTDEDFIYFENNRFESYRELCKFYNINYRTFLSRQHRGWSLVECVYDKQK